MMRRENLLALFCFACVFSVPACALLADSAKIMRPIQIEDTIRGISLTKRARFLVSDIRIGETSVIGLFSNSDDDAVSSEDYLSWKEESVTIRLKEDRFLSHLKYLALTNEPAYLSVYLVDPREDGLLRWLREHIIPFPFLGFSMELKYPFVADLPTCDRVTQIIYNGIDSHLQDEITKAGQTQASIGLDQLFLLLRQDRLESFMDKLGPIDRKCPDAFRLLRWIRNEQVHGFDYEQYSLKPELRAVLDSISKSISRFQKWRRYDFYFSVIGYTDPDPVQEKEKSRFFLEPAKTGVKSLVPKSRLQIFYGGCSGDHLAGATPHYINFFSSDGQQVRSPIENNCELGAVRAYVATAFLVERMGRTNMKYEYASGGVSPSGTDNSIKRKVDLNIVVKAATLQRSL